MSKDFDTTSNAETGANPESPLFDIQLLKPNQAASLIGMSPRTLRRNTELLGIPHIRVGQHRRYQAASLAQWAKEREVS